MADKFDAKAEARLVEKLLKLADEASTRSGGSIVAQRLIDYAADELQGLASGQLSEVLAIIDPKLEKTLLQDGQGFVHGFVYSRGIYVPLKARPESANGGHRASAPQMFASLRTAAAPKRSKSTASKPAKSNKGKTKNKASGKQAAAKRSSPAEK